ncbi:MAG: hypothetical protein ACKV2U_33710 [Bryobacteraceae bacterium]
MRAIIILSLGAALSAEPMTWADLPPAIRALLAQARLTEAEFPAWLVKHNEASTQRLAAGAAEHIAYFLLQSKQFIGTPPMDPVTEARRYFDSLPQEARKAFLTGEPSAAPLADPVRRRMDAFWNTRPVSDRHRILREMAARLDWPPEQVVQTAFRFLMQRSANPDPDVTYQARGLSADPFPGSMRAVERGLNWMRANRARPLANVLLVGPGAELGSRFGVEDLQPVISPQPKALLKLLGKPPLSFTCVDIRPEVVTTLTGAPCSASTLDVVTERLPSAAYDLAVATNVLVYLDDNELAVSLANLAAALIPGGCLLHNDSRFAARLFGEAAGMPVKIFEPVTLGRRVGREQMDRIVVHCKLTTTP